ncbi:MAG: HAD family hydrolase [Streptococcaceae bacterium]|jgi:putative hydrolase of the HAD superfamily|nr:HAD family hydrolase [Streptococcaceae bacterium]
MTIKTIIFDLDGTLLSEEAAVQQAFDRTLAFLTVQQPQVNAAEVEQGVRRHAAALFTSYDFYDFAVQIGISALEGLWGAFDDGSLRFPQMASQIEAYRLNVWCAALEDVGLSDRRLAKILSLMFIAHRLEAAVTYEDTYPVLERLVGHYQLLLLTNGAPSLQRLKLKAAPELLQYFEKINISGGFGKGKPAPELFEHTLSLAQADPATTVMVGDQLFTDILGGNTAGIRTIWLNRTAKQGHEEVVPTASVRSLTEVAQWIENEEG